MKYPFASIIGTTACDGHCVFCQRWQEPAVSMDPDLACRSIDEFPSVGVKVVDITGGQPSLWEGLKPSVDRCRKNRLRNTVTVSGPSALNVTDWVETIWRLRISVHGTRSEQDTLQGDGFYNANLEFLTLATKRRHPLSTELVFTIRSAHSLESFEAVDSLARRFQTRVICNLEWGLSLDRDLLRLIDQFRRKPLWVCSLAKIRYYLCGGNNRLNPTCGADRMIVLCGDRIVQPCMEYRDRLPSISLDQGSLKDLLESPARQAWRKMTGRWDFCHGCTISCPNMLGLWANCYRRYAAWLHLPTFGQRFRDAVIQSIE